MNFSIGFGSLFLYLACYTRLVFQFGFSNYCSRYHYQLDPPLGPHQFQQKIFTAWGRGGVQNVL